MPEDSYFYLVVCVDQSNRSIMKGMEKQEMSSDSVIQSRLSLRGHLFYWSFLGFIGSVFLGCLHFRVLLYFEVFFPFFSSSLFLGLPSFQG